MQLCRNNLMQFCRNNVFNYICFVIKRRSTISKDAVLSILTIAKRAMSQDAIVGKMEVDADRATVYRILNRFCEDGVVHRIVADDGKQYFAICTKCDEKIIPDNHFHFRCTRCETIECLPARVEFSLPKKYKVNSVNCILVGLCENCA